MRLICGIEAMLQGQIQNFRRTCDGLLPSVRPRDKPQRYEAAARVSPAAFRFIMLVTAAFSVFGSVIAICIRSAISHKTTSAPTILARLLQRRQKQPPIGVIPNNR